MSGLYNMIFPGAYDRGQVLLPVLGIRSFDDVGRFRDAWVERDDTGRLWVHLYTRLGGLNRDDYATVIANLRANPNYARDADDSYDNTYASFWFRVPATWTTVLEGSAVDPIDPGERWRTVLEQVGEHSSEAGKKADG